MSDLLSRTLRERADVPAPAVDIAAILQDGDRRVRRRRRTTGLGAALVVALVAAVAAVLPALHHDRRPEAPTGPPLAPHAVSYARGEAIHDGDLVIDTGHEVRSYVRTSGGIVFADGSGRVWLADGVAVERIGTTAREGLYLKSDETGPLAAWVGYPDGARPELVVYDTVAREVVLRTTEGTKAGMGSFRDTDAVYVYAVDRAQVYWRNTRGAVRTDVGTGRTTVLRKNAYPFDVDDVRAGWIVYAAPGGRPATFVGRTMTSGRELPASGSARLSPTARYVAFEDADVRRIFEVRTGREVEVETPGYSFAVVLSWLDDDRPVVGALKNGDDETVDLLSCRVSTGRCVPEVTGIGVDGLTFPTGEELG